MSELGDRLGANGGNKPPAQAEGPVIIVPPKVLIDAQWRPEHFAAPVSPGFKATPLDKRMVPSISAVSFIYVLNPSKKVFAEDGHKLFLRCSIAQDFGQGKQFIPEEDAESNPVEGSRQCVHGNMGRIEPLPPRTQPSPPLPAAINCGVMLSEHVQCLINLKEMVNLLADRSWDAIFEEDFKSSAYEEARKIAKPTAIKIAKDLGDMAVSTGKAMVDTAIKNSPMYMGYQIGQYELKVINDPAGEYNKIKNEIDTDVNKIKAAAKEAARITNTLIDSDKRNALIEKLKKKLMDQFADNACEAAEAMAAMLTSPTPLARQLGKMAADLAGKGIEIGVEAVVIAVVTRGAGALARGALAAEAAAGAGAAGAEAAEAAAGAGAAAEKGGGFLARVRNAFKKIAGGARGRKLPSIPCKDCAVAGFPVSTAYGCKVLFGEEELDFDLPAPLPLPWQRTYTSDFAHTGWLGQGWNTPFSLQIQRQGNGRALVDEQGRRLMLPEPELGQPYHSRFEQFIFSATEDGGFEITSEDGDVRLCFTALGLPEDADASARAKAPLHVFTRMLDTNGNAIELIYGPLPEPLRQPGAFEPEEAAALIVPQAIIDSAGRRLRLDFAPVGAAGEPRLPDQPRGLRLTQVVQITGPRLGPGLASVPLAQPRVLVRYLYSTAGDLVQVRNALDQVTREFVYNNHVMVEHRTADGLVSRYEYTEYTPGGKVLRNWLSDGRQWRFKYGGGYTDVIHTTNDDAQGRKRRWFHDKDKHYTGHIDELGGRLKHELDAFGNLIALTDEAGRVTSYTLDARGLPTQITSPDGASTRIAYDPQLGKITQITSPDEAVTRRRYDTRGNLIETTDALGHSTGYQYDSRGLPIVITDALGRNVKLDYNSAGQITAMTDCTGQRTLYEWDAWDHLERITDALGQVTHYQHDALGRLLQVRHPDGALEQFEYNRAGRLTVYTDALGGVTRYQYGQDGQVLERHDAQGGVLRYEYDGARRLRALHNENAARYDFAWDALDRLAAETGFDGRHTRYRYDPTGLVLSKLEQGCLTAGQRQQLHPARPRDASGQPPWRGDPTWQNPWGERLSVQDTPLQAPPGQGIITRYQYDVLGRLIAKQVAGHALQEDDTLQPQYRSTSYAYDQAGRLGEAVNDAGARVALGYDAMGQLISESRTGQGLDSRIAHQYDALGNRIQSTLPNRRRVNWLYYGAGHLHQINIDGQVISDIERDALYRESGRTQGSLISRYGYDALGRLTAQAAWRTAADQNRPGIWSALDEPPSAQLSNLPRAVGTPFIGRRYRYDPAGNLTELQDRRAGQTQYQYDKIGRIMQAIQPGLHERFAFDPAHNLIEAGQDPVKSNRLEVFEDKRYRYDTHGNLIEKKTGAHTVLRLVWDIEHRLQRVVRTTTTGDKAQTSITHYRYDAFGRRLEKKVCPKEQSNKQSKAAIQRILYEWDGDYLLSEQSAQKQTLYLYEPNSFAPLAQVVMPLEEAPNQPKANLPREVQAIQALIPPGEKLATITLPDEDDIEANIRAFNRQMNALQAATMGRVQSMQGADGVEQPPEPELTPAQMWPEYKGLLPQGWEKPKAQDREEAKEKTERSWQVYYYHCDHLGTPREVTDEQGQIHWEGSYRTWGNTRKVQATGQIQQNLRFQGQYFDEETGLHYNRFRYYDPEIGRFVSQDPIGLEGGVNQFVFAFNPTGWLDPLGLAATGTMVPGSGLRAEGIGTRAGRSALAGGTGARHPVVRMLYGMVKNRSRYHGKCVEAEILSNVAFELEEKLKIKITTVEQLKKYVEGSTMTVHTIGEGTHGGKRNKNKKDEHKNIRPCGSCKCVLQILGIKSINLNSIFSNSHH